MGARGHEGRHKNIINSLYIEPEGSSASSWSATSAMPKSPPRKPLGRDRWTTPKSASSHTASRRLVCRSSSTPRAKRASAPACSRPITLWPYPSAQRRRLRACGHPPRARRQPNMGQMIDDVRLAIIAGCLSSFTDAPAACCRRPTRYSQIESWTQPKRRAKTDGRVVFGRPSIFGRAAAYINGLHARIVHRLAEAIDQLGIEGKTVGTRRHSVFAYNFFECDMVQAPHGRAGRRDRRQARRPTACSPTRATATCLLPRPSTPARAAKTSPSYS